MPYDYEPRHEDPAWSAMHALIDAQLLRCQGEAISHGFEPHFYQHLKLSKDMFATYGSVRALLGEAEARAWLDGTLQRMSVMLERLAGISIKIQIAHKEE